MNHSIIEDTGFPGHGDRPRLKARGEVVGESGEPGARSSASAVDPPIIRCRTVRDKYGTAVTNDGVDLRASGRHGKLLAAGLEGGEEDRKRGLRIGTSAGEDIESEISVLGISVERDVRLRKEEVAREATPFEPVQHRRADRLHPTPTRRIVETIGQQPGIGQTVGGNVVKVGEQVLTDH